MYRKLMTTRCRKVDAVAQKAAFALLEGAYHLVVEPSAETQRAAMMRVSSETPTTRPKVVEEVDLETDPRVFVVLDGCCNKRCRVRGRLEKAEPIFESRGRQVGTLFGEPESYKGIGQKRTAGCRNIPLGVLLDNGQRIEGAVESNGCLWARRRFLVSVRMSRQVRVISKVMMRVRHCAQWQDCGQFAYLVSPEAVWYLRRPRKKRMNRQMVLPTQETKVDLSPSSVEREVRARRATSALMRTQR
jgi:hypothetical protein